MTAIVSSQNTLAAVRIPYVTGDETHTLLSVALDRCLALVETLSLND